MAFVLKFERDPGSEVLALLHAELDSARALLSVSPTERTAWRNGIHDARRAMRRMRTLLRLLPATATHAAVLTHLRVAGQALSPLRDAQALPETVVLLQRRQPGLLGSAHADLLAHLMQRLRRIERAQVGHPVVAAQALQAVDTLLADCSAAIATEAVWAAIRHGSARAARAARAVRAGNDESALHRWRRRARDHALQLELVGRCWPAVLSAQVAEHKRLARQLGQLRDLALLQRQLRVMRRETLGRLQRQSLMERLYVARATLRAEAVALGALVHAESPRRLAARIAAYHAAGPHAAD